ncbi:MULTISPECIES: efflux RND transporter periplasmic adaptor subunit [Pseudoxanthomonas]|uniref:RND family efflux transporter MFP subunit n=1 Tax=Pseudoxanthomonas winnipegensis TaxID=2480810 RepID=A0AAW8G9K2_9GAMM|nr:MULTISPECIES: efflux RND transporter periplasmic adaptor subunit [Pseudoxanthomonas]MDQ1117900.1 RND family efflux transporter MFP subunit [Pseudoxanthomonas winnipegensis]MDQ1134871.1 RND family efflux transporter MFP subunit [Pseudoxanthomonas winnipegensis]MDR6138896.1 RND family efflux transporter MFP subunit [Pseudoxanthomonas sp. SORGH_AS_0997]
MNASAELLKELRIDRSKAPPPAPSRKGVWIAVVVVLVLLVLAAAAWFALGRAKPVQVRTATVAAMTGGADAPASVLDATGYVVARRTATVSAQITGRVEEVMIEEGQRVEAGQILARLDPINADAEKRLAQSQLSSSQSQVQNVQAQLTRAEAEARRLDALVNQQLVSRSQFDQQVAERDALRAQLETARRNVQVARDQLKISSIGKDYTVVRAPFAGVITAKAAQPGEIVSPLSAGGGFTRTGIGTIVDMDSLEVEVDVGEAYIGRVQPKMPVVATLNAYPDWKIPAEVIAVIPTADRGKATVKVRIALKVKDPRIVPEMGVNVSFLEAAPRADAPAPQGVRVPAAAVVERDGVPVAFVVEGDKVQRRTLKPGQTLASERQILDGLRAGEQVVLDPPATLKDGDSVAVGDGAPAS